MVGSRSKAKPAAPRAAAYAHATSTTAALTAFGLISFVATARGTRPSRALQRNHQVGWDGIRQAVG
jgi:hypothetical protein